MADVPQYTTVARPRDYWMSPKALSITRDALGEANRIAASVTGGSQFFCHFEDIGDQQAETLFGYDVAHNFRSWPLNISQTYFNTNDAILPHIAIPRRDKSDAKAMVVFPTERLDLWGYATDTVPMQDEDGNYIDDKGDIVDRPEDAATAYVRKKKSGSTTIDDDPIGSEDYYYIYLHGRLTSSGSGGTIPREWDPEIDTGRLNTDETWGEVITLEQLAREMKKKVDVEWFQRVFTIHGTGRKRKILDYDEDGNPIYDYDEDGNIIYEATQEGDDERRDIKPNDMDHEITDTQSMFGTWTEQFLSALGIGSGSGSGGGGDALEWPLLDINTQGMPGPSDIGGPKTGDAIVYDSTLNGGAGGFKWGKTGGGLSGLHIFDGATEIQPTISGDSYTYRLSDNFLSLRSNTTQNVQSPLLLSGNVAITGANLAITNGTLTIASRPQGFAAGDNDVLTKKETETLFDGKYVTVAFFQSLFELHQGDANNTLIPTNTDLSTYTAQQKALFNIKSMFGTWTEQYLSALGIGSDGSSGGVAYLSLLEDVNVGTLSPTDNGKALIYDSTLDKWVKGSAGIDTNQLNTILHGKTLIITDGSVQLGNTWYADAGGSIDISTIFTRKKWWNATMSNGEVKGDIQLTGNITPETNDTAADPGSTIGTTALRYRAIYVNEIYIGDAKISWDSTNRGLHLTKGVYSDEWVSSLGTGSQGGSGGMDWEALTDWDYDQTHVIDAHYLKNVTKLLTITNADGSTTYGTYDGTSPQTIRIPSGVSNLSALTITNGTTAAVVYTPTDAQPKTLTVSGQKVNSTDVLTVTAGTGTLAIALADNYGDTKNPYAAKAARKVLAGPTSGTDLPAFRDLEWADIKTGKPTSWWGQSTIDENGAVKGHIQYTGNITPENSDQYTIGSSTFRYDKAYVKELWIGGVQVNVENGGLHIHQAGLYADTYVSSLGTGSGGGGGTPLNDLLMSMNGASIVPGTQTNQVIVYDGNGSWSFQPYNSGGGGGGGSISNVYLWGNTFNGTQNVDGNIRLGYNSGNDGFISGCSHIDSALYFIKSGSTISQVNIGSASSATYTNGTDATTGNPNDITPKLYVDGHFGVKENIFAKSVELYNTKPYIDFHYGSSTADYTTRIIESGEGVLTIQKKSGATGLVVGGSANADYIKIGGATITWDYSNQALRIDKGLYSDSFVSSLGTGSGGSSGGGGADLSDVWASLTTHTDAYKDFKIDNNHLSFDTNFGSMAKETASDYVKYEDLGTLTITVGSTTKRWNATQDETIEISGGDSPYTLPAASSDALGGIKIGYSQDDTNKRYPVKLSDEKAYVEVPWTDMKDTAGVTSDNTHQLYLVGSTEYKRQQTGYAVTNVNEYCYIKDNCLYSNGSKVLTSALALGDLSNVTISSPTAGQALVYRNGGWLNETISASVPLAASGTRGGIQIGFTKDDTNKRYPVELSSEKAYVEVPWTDTNTDTKNTAGNSQSDSTLLYLIAGSSSTSQNSSTQTYTNSKCYIGTDNCLYSNGSKVLTSALALGDLSNVTISSPTAGQALVYRNGGWLNETISASVPLAASGTRGGIQIGFTQDDTNKRYPVKLSSEKAYVEVPWTDTNTDTKNTAGNSQSNSTLLYLIAGSSSTSQNSSTQTYTNSKCYIGTDNCLYSNGSKVLTEAVTGFLPTTGGEMTGGINFKNSSGTYSMKLEYSSNQFGFYSDTNSDWIFYYNQSTKRAHFGSKLNLCNLFGTNVILYGINSGTETEGLRVLKSGDVHIGQSATATGYTLTVNGKSYLKDDVGIGTTPDTTYKLKVNGAGYFSGNLKVASGKKIYIGTAEVLTTGNTVTTDNVDQTIAGNKKFTGLTTAAKIQAPYVNTTAINADATESLSICYGSGNGGSVAIAAASVPDNVGSPKFYVNGNSAFAGCIAINSAVNTSYKLYVSGSSYMNGNVGIGGAPNNNYKLQVSGKIHADDNIETDESFVGSDMRRKNVMSIMTNDDLSLENVARAPLFRFIWNDKDDKMLHVGTSAQYWQTLLPELITTGGNNRLYQDYAATALASAITIARTVLTHDDEIAALKRRVDDVEQENKQLRKEIELLKAA